MLEPLGSTGGEGMLGQEWVRGWEGDHPLTGCHHPAFSSSRTVLSHAPLLQAEVLMGKYF